MILCFGYLNTFNIVLLIVVTSGGIVFGIIEMTGKSGLQGCSPLVP